MTNYAKFPDYIYSPETGYVYVTKTNQKFMEEGEYKSGPKTFSSSTEAKQYLADNNFNGVLGVRFNL